MEALDCYEDMVDVVMVRGTAHTLNGIGIIELLQEISIDAFRARNRTDISVA